MGHEGCIWVGRIGKDVTFRANIQTHTVAASGHTVAIPGDSI
jgi:hypothetical protein